MLSIKVQSVSLSVLSVCYDQTKLHHLGSSEGEWRKNPESMLFLVPIPTVILTLWPVMNKENGDVFNLLKRQPHFLFAEDKGNMQKMTLEKKKKFYLGKMEK